MSHIMEMTKITKKFGDFIANDNVDIFLDEGEVLTILGENGAGKSTLMNVLCGLYSPTQGEIKINGNVVNIDNPAKAVNLGIGMVHQHFMLIECMTVFDNIILGKTGRDNDRELFIDKNKIKSEIMEISNKYGLTVDLDKKISEISIGEQQRVEIIKALYRGAKILILDEPTAVLTDEEVEGLFTIINKLKSEKKSIIFISHKMREVMEISDRITILRDGKSVETIKKCVTCGQELANTMVGREIKECVFEKVDSNQDNMVSLENISYKKGLKHGGLNNLSLNIRKGEVLGIAGVDGNGQSQLAMVLSGLLKPDEGQYLLDGKKIDVFNPKFFIDEKVGHIPEDRNRMGLVGDMSIAENLVLKETDSDKFSYNGGLRLKHNNIIGFSNEMKTKYDIRCTDTNALVKNLSGGNQQKVILAREIEANPKFLIAVHPTRGLDIGATMFVHEKIIEARDNGCAVLLISADLDEVLKVSDRIIVLYEGKVMGQYSGKNPDMESISLDMAGRLGE